MHRVSREPFALLLKKNIVFRGVNFWSASLRETKAKQLPYNDQCKTISWESHSTKQYFCTECAPCKIMFLWYIVWVSYLSSTIYLGNTCYVVRVNYGVLLQCCTWITTTSKATNVLWETWLVSLVFFHNLWQCRMVSFLLKAGDRNHSFKLSFSCSRLILLFTDA